MKVPNSPITGKPMRVVYTPDTMKYRGDEYECVCISFRDDETGEEFTTTESDTVWYNQVTNQYREKYGIPYVDEIIALRERYGLSATKMSVVLGFGANQYRLYEDGEVPSESNGKMIRSASNPKVFLDLVHGSRHQLAEKEYDKICSRIQNIIGTAFDYHKELVENQLIYRRERGAVNGFAPRSSKRMKNLLLYILEKLGDTFQTKMNKVLFYIDFLSYRERGMAISGLAYQALDFGPVPLRWDRVYSAFDEVEQQPRLVRDQEGIALTSSNTSDLSQFSQQEIAIINTVCNKLKNITAHDISEMSHNEPAWKNHLHQPDPIPFSEAFSLVAL
ncbi:MAG: DUF4065 domain-containing protein [Bacteroidales bacterium]|nr:DUF4065 domain-containing protein [Bacteroidales bacterium]